MLEESRLDDGSDFPQEVLAYNDSDEIVMFERTMHDAEIVQVLMHEAYHNWCIVRGRHMSSKHEHEVMAILGDPNEISRRLIEERRRNGVPSA